MIRRPGCNAAGDGAETVSSIDIAKFGRRSTIRCGIVVLCHSEPCDKPTTRNADIDGVIGKVALWTLLRCFGSGLGHSSGTEKKTGDYQ